MLFRQLFDQVSSTYSYVLADERTREAVLVDPVFEQHARDEALIRELGLKLLMTIDTHCHADHVTGAWLMKAALGSAIALSHEYGAGNVDRPLSDGDVVRFGSATLEIRATPGHTAGCLSLVTADQRMVFTGDALLVRGAGRTDFQQGDAGRLFRSIRDRLLVLPDACAVYPAQVGARRLHPREVRRPPRRQPRRGDDPLARARASVVGARPWARSDGRSSSDLGCTVPVRRYARMDRGAGKSDADVETCAYRTGLDRARGRGRARSGPRRFRSDACLGRLADDDAGGALR
jgi:glyoxylase-like metal-dependent hydrolase (beta-lactamase superfamily II)